MIRSAIIFLIVNYCATLFSQDKNSSRSFPASRKSIPLQILNNHPDYFFLLRYNKEVHDLIVERRTKPSAEITKFTALKLDSVNADWFDYERLDYLFFEYDEKVYFVFEKVLNKQRTLYMKEINSSGIASGFIEVLQLEKNALTAENKLDFKFLPSGEIGIVTTTFLKNGFVRKTISNYNIKGRKISWSKNIPDTERELEFTFPLVDGNSSGLIFVYGNQHFIEFRREYRRQVQMQMPVYGTDGLFICNQNEADSIKKIPLIIPGLQRLQNIYLEKIDSLVLIFVKYTVLDSNTKEQLFFFTGKFSLNQQRILADTIQTLSASSGNKLTYYDGTDYNNPAYKNFWLTSNFTVTDTSRLLLMERRDDDMYNELLALLIDSKNGYVTSQSVVPRKIYFSQNQQPFKNLGNVHTEFLNEKIHFFLLENQSNNRLDPENYRFHKFTRQSYLKNGSLAWYAVSKNGLIDKTIVHENGDFDFTPLKYSGNCEDFIFYLSKPKAEKFVILKLNP